MMRARSTVACLSLLAAAATLGACSGSNSNYQRLPCGAPSGQIALAYPAPGATGIPDNFQGVVFASSSGLTSGYQAIVVPAGSASGTSLDYVATAPSPLPSPNATPGFANPVYQESASNGYILPAATQVSVYLNDANSNCVPTTVLGTFTSQ